jgi:hypothetical protein
MFVEVEFSPEYAFIAFEICASANMLGNCVVNFDVNERFAVLFQNLATHIQMNLFA